MIFLKLITGVKVIKANGRELDIDIGNQHIVVQRRYEALGAFNDLMIAVWFLIGSFFFLNDSLVESGTWLFVVGSAQLIIKPIIKLISLVHVGILHNISLKQC
uniref:YrhK domain-containing protein n=1 Tax=Marinomonas sp. (strain MWYL1) TaxID=400668 RepID=A6VWH7_MARMS